MPIFSEYARKCKIAYFMKGIPKQAEILEVGCGDGWLESWLKQNDYANYAGLDLVGPARVIGDIRDWKKFGIEPESVDVLIAFEVIEHVNCIQEFFDILKPGGLLLLTSPVPHMDWVCKLLELCGLTQKRTSPHRHLRYFDSITLFERVELRTVGLAAQWGKFRKPIPQLPAKRPLTSEPAVVRLPEPSRLCSSGLVITDSSVPLSLPSKVTNF